MPNSFIEDLQWRGLIHQCTDMVALNAQLSAGPVTLYCGFDPTALSLHAGSLIPLITLARFQAAGHRVLGLVGGATGRIGDPSGKSAERVLQTPQEVSARADAVRAQIGRFIDLSNPESGAVVDNLEWTANVGVLDFLRDVGKHFSVNAMVARDSVKSRLNRDGDGISFTEFSYMLLQAHDFLKLFEREGCTLQVGGSDQWGNMCSGADLIRRVHGASAQALTFPLLTNSQGEKFGKTAKGAVWLDAGMTTPWEFFQFWRNVDDVDVVRLLKLFTFLSRAEIEALETETLQQPHLRRAQQRLATELTSLVHGAATAAVMAEVAVVLFGKGSVAQLSQAALQTLTSALPCVRVAGPLAEVRISKALTQLGLAPSGTSAVTAIKAGAISVNETRMEDPQGTLETLPALQGAFWLVRKGKSSFGVLTTGDVPA